MAVNVKTTLIDWFCIAFVRLLPAVARMHRVSVPPAVMALGVGISDAVALVVDKALLARAFPEQVPANTLIVICPATAALPVAFAVIE
ncbi:hypothetical protein GS502_04635 [Rhodococcus hoagii]|nr:hypothetical protein [Prescottella equi]